MDEMVAVSSETKEIPINIMSTAKTRPPGVSGEKSPYPTVVMVTIAHQNGLLSFEISPGSNHCKTTPPIIIVIKIPAPT